jgi:hypothetical protein
MAASLATRAQFYRHGLRPGAVAPSPRTVEAVDATTDTLTLRGHGLAVADPLEFVNVGGALPGGLSAAVVVYAIPVEGSDALFQVAETAEDAEAGTQIPITSAGSGAHRVVLAVGPLIDDALEVASDEVRQALRAHGELESPLPPSVVAWICRLAAAAVLRVLGLQNPAQREGAQPYFDAEAQTRLELARCAKGVPLIGATDDTPAVAENGAVFHAVTEDARGWGSGDSL